GLTGHELGLAHRPHLRGAGGPVHRVALEEHGGDQVVAGGRVGQEVGQEVTVAAAVPQVMVGVDDRQVRLEDRLGRVAGQPRLVGRMDAPELGRARRGRGGHRAGRLYGAARRRSRASLAASAGKKHSTRSSWSVMSYGTPRLARVEKNFTWKSPLRISTAR